MPKREFLELSYQKELDKNLLHRIKWNLTKLSKLAKERCDILFVPGGVYLGSFRPFVVMAQNLLPFDYEVRKIYLGSFVYLKLKVLEVVQRKTFINANCVIFVSEHSKKIIESKINKPLKNVKIIPHGVSKRFKRTEAEINVHNDRLKRKIENDEEINILYVSSIAKYKNQIDLIKAVADERKTGKKLKLTLIGGNYWNAVKDLRKKIKEFDPQNEFINYLGEVKYDKIDRYYKQTDYFVFPSLCESFGLPYHEALAMGISNIFMSINQFYLLHSISVEKLDMWDTTAVKTFNTIKENYCKKATY